MWSRSFGDQQPLPRDRQACECDVIVLTSTGEDVRVLRTLKGVAVAAKAGRIAKFFQGASTTLRESTETDLMIARVDIINRTTSILRLPHPYLPTAPGVGGGLNLP